MQRTRVGILAIVAVVSAAAWLQQSADYNQNSHYALVRALADGTPQVDSALGEIGELSTRDLTRWHGHYYSDKAPGLALATLPAFVALDATGLVEPGEPTDALWLLGLVGVVLPFGLLLLMVRAVAEQFEPGFGTAAAVTIGLGSILLPYSTLFYSHLLSASLVFGAFFVLYRARGSGRAFRPVWIAGVLAGLAMTTEYPNGIAALLLGAYAVADRPRVARAVAYGSGVIVGMIPLALYDWWAFGSITHISRTGSLTAPDPHQGLFGVGLPSARAALELLFSTTGLLTLAPVVVCGLAALPILYARGQRREALLFAAIAAAYIAFNTGYDATFGGFAPGPRYVIPILPFIAVGLATAFRMWPTLTTGLATVSIVVMSAITATHALAGYNLGWFDRIADRQFTETAASLVGVTGWYAIVPFFAAVALAVVLAIAATRPPRVSSVETIIGGGAVAAWAALAAAAPVQKDLGGRGQEYGAYGFVLVVLGLGAAVALIRAYGTRLRDVGPPRRDSH